VELSLDVSDVHLHGGWNRPGDVSERLAGNVYVAVNRSGVHMILAKVT
jgi:hypothetical protein